LTASGSGARPRQGSDAVTSSVSSASSIFRIQLGLLYSAVTSYTGFKVNSGEYKVMGLAPYGEPRYASTVLDHIVDIKPDGSFRLDQSYFDYCTGLSMTSPKFAALFGEPVRAPEAPPTQFHMDMAASVQKVTEEVMLRLTRSLQAETGASNLCLAGGVALNCVANGKILRDAKFKKIWIQPAAGDAGGALGAALSAYYGFLNQPRQPACAADGMCGAYLGPAFLQEDIDRRLAEAGARFDSVDTPTMLARTAQDLAAGRAVGWFQGRMEFGPRALGARSILGDARSPTMQKTLNLRVKYRECFRPFAPSILSEHVSEWFEIEAASPYMLMVADIVQGRRRSTTAQDRRGSESTSSMPFGPRSPLSRTSIIRRASRPCIGRPIQSTPLCSSSSANSPAVLCSSIRLSMCAASRSCARPRTLFAAFWVPTLSAWSLAMP